MHELVLTAQGVSSHHKAGRIVSCITDCIQRYTKKFDVFIEVLRGDPFLHGIVEKLLAECRK